MRSRWERKQRQKAATPTAPLSKESVHSNPNHSPPSSIRPKAKQGRAYCSIGLAKRAVELGIERAPTKRAEGSPFLAQKNRSLFLSTHARVGSHTCLELDCCHSQFPPIAWHPSYSWLLASLLLLLPGFSVLTALPLKPPFLVTTAILSKRTLHVAASPQ
jgi:hypothetical protein